MTVNRPRGAQFEISIDGTPCTYRDEKVMAIEAAEQLKRKHPHSAVTVENLQTGEKTTVEYKSEGPRELRNDAFRRPGGALIRPPDTN